MNFELSKNKIDEFLAIQTRRELAEVLDIQYSSLIYNLYKVSNDRKYREFTIPKKSGGTRTILAPICGIKNAQKKLSFILLAIYPPKSCVHSYLKGKGIVTNAKQHVNKRYVINIDLKNFFPSINFGRVHGLFKSYPFNFNDEVATILAQICCHNNFLPQGAPTSPILSNYICRRMDNDILKLVNKHKFTYSRYADDLTFSSNLMRLPKALGRIQNKKIIVGKKISRIIQENGFEINDLKIRYATRNNRQEVTGLISNQFVNVNREYIKNVRAMIHAWEKFGLENAGKEHFLKNKLEQAPSKATSIAFEKMLVGKIGFIGMIRGKHDFIYNKLVERIKTLSPSVKLAVLINYQSGSDKPIIFGEGKSDWKHLKAALTKLKNDGFYTSLDITFREYEKNVSISSSELFELCKAEVKTGYHKNPIICIFDSDVLNLIKQVTEEGKLYKSWGNNVFSFVLPLLKHRTFSEICIEHFYEDSELKITDKEGRRIFTSDEFDENGKHLSENYYYTSKKSRLRKNYPFIIDDHILNEQFESKALSKEKFANYILNKIEPFNNMSFEHFKSIFFVIESIVNDPQK